MGQQQKSASPRRYPPLYERLIPVALVVLLASTLFLIVVSIAVIFGWIGR